MRVKILVLCRVIELRCLLMVSKSRVYQLVSAIDIIRDAINLSHLHGRYLRVWSALLLTTLGDFTFRLV